MKEIFKSIPGFDKYEVSNLGSVRNKSTNKVLKPHLTRNGYLDIRLFKKGLRKGKRFSIHRLVMSAFVGDSPLTVDHINRDKTDNRLPNLRYLTNEENARLGNIGNTNAQGSKNHHAKLTETIVREIKQYLSQGLSVKELAAQYNIGLRTIYHIKAGSRWGHVV